MDWYHAVSSNLTTCVETKEIIAYLSSAKNVRNIADVTASLISIWVGLALGFTGPAFGDFMMIPNISHVLPTLLSAMAQSPFYKSCHHLRQETGAQHCVVTKGKYHFKVSGSLLGSQATAVLDNTHTIGIPIFSHRPAGTS